MSPRRRPTAHRRSQAREPSPRERERADSGVCAHSGIEHLLASDLVAVLFEHVEGAVFVLDAGDDVIAMNETGRALGRRVDVVQIGRSGDAVVDSHAGPLRVVRREVTTANEVHRLLFVEPFAVDHRELLRIAIAAWRPTERQGEVLEYVLEGHANKEIAEAVGVSPRTIEVHVTALLDKAGVDSRARLIARARELAARKHAGR